ncbi:alpha/beta fold hydrolase [Maritimibacter sp. UBA3975]|uniref:alpha/beta hydrolase n=1 Tax=Maritimibacter sp. UBA3975 TaxID=1946833 RepID=UPI000C0B3A44|nr:alpha/beta fold hydrolase [Maritimibacter sp. UBA3975]MAM60270.1 alpha/beta hydrolase [Maritimibacter sp.]|tara:strand:+ start:14808 stop:16736 length:1929 start_codon:yes stop_codon:yes gene_type:complete
MTPDQIIATVISLLSAEPNPEFDTLREGGHDNRYPVSIENCTRPLGPLEVEGHTVICGRIDVPEDHDVEDGNTVPIAFAVLKARSKAPAEDPVVYLHGGPGGNAVQDIQFNAGIFDFLRDRRDLVFFDQRASGLSDRTVACYNEFADDFMDFARPNPAEMFSPGGPLATCMAETMESGVDVSLYNTTQSAKDVRAIMQTLGYPIYNAFGVSYGTKLAQELMRTAPEGLRSVVIDSISRVDNPAYDTNGVPIDQALGWIVDLCAEDAGCAAAYPDLEATVNDAGDRLAETPVSLGGGKIGPRLISQLLEQSNHTNAAYTAYMPQILTELSRGETATLERLTSGGFMSASSPAAIVAQYGDGLDRIDATLAAAILQQAEQLRGLETTTGNLLSALAEDLSPAGAAGTEQMLDGALTEVSRTMEADDLMAMMRDYVGFIARDPSRTDIETFVRTHVPDVARARLLGLVAAMDDDDVTAFFQRARHDSARLTSGARMMLTLGFIACQEDFPFNSREGYDAVAADYRFPLVDAYEREDVGPLYGFCDLFEHHPREGYHEPVESDLPVLAMSGMKDTATNPDAAKMVSRTLPNAQALLFPEAGHTVIQFSQCARDIAAGFLESPGEPVNDACIQGLRPTFYVPMASGR